MKGRDVFQLTAGALLGSGAAVIRPRLHTRAAGQAAANGKLKGDLYSRHLHRLPRALGLGAMKRDLLTLRRGFSA